MPFFRPFRATIVVAPLLLAISILFLLAAVAAAAPPAVPGIEPPPPPREPRVAAASGEPEAAKTSFGLPEGFAAEAWAAEPLLANPVAFSLDEQGRAYVCEAFRAHKGVGDNVRINDDRWLDADLANDTVDERFASMVRILGKKAKDWVVETDRLRRVVDSDGDGRGDTATVFATGFNRLIDGHGAGVLARRGDVFYACIPHLWRFRDADGDGLADEKLPLHVGYGVRTAIQGHDLHGLTLGPDGRLWFSIGDRGYHVEHEGGVASDPESGAVFRCEPDGSNLEVVATGLRNPQELAFDDLGHCFTCDNNTDGGDRTRLVHVVPGGDSGWRGPVQYLPDRGPFNREQLWRTAFDGQSAWILPPVGHVGAGPAGFAAYPGTGLTPWFDGRFFLADFRGAAATSLVHTFRVRPLGASFELIDADETFRHILATDVEMGPDGALWVSDWVQGWEGDGKGRLWRFFPTGLSAEESEKRQAIVDEVRLLLAADWTLFLPEHLDELLDHPDRRLRREAQFELARRRDIATLAQDGFKKIGVEIKVELYEWAVFLKNHVNKGDFDAMVLGWSLGNDYDQFQIWHSSQTNPEQLNVVGYKNPEVDKLLESIRQEYNRDKIISMAGQMQSIIYREQPYLFLYVPQGTSVMWKNSYRICRPDGKGGWIDSPVEMTKAGWSYWSDWFYRPEFKGRLPAAARK